MLQLLTLRLLCAVNVLVCCEIKHIDLQVFVC